MPPRRRSCRCSATGVSRRQSWPSQRWSSLAYRMQRWRPGRPWSVRPVRWPGACCGQSGPACPEGLALFFTEGQWHAIALAWQVHHIVVAIAIGLVLLLQQTVAAAIERGGVYLARRAPLLQLAQEDDLIDGVVDATHSRQGLLAVCGGSQHDFNALGRHEDLGVFRQLQGLSGHGGTQARKGKGKGSEKNAHRDQPLEWGRWGNGAKSRAPVVL